VLRPSLPTWSSQILRLLISRVELCGRHTIVIMSTSTSSFAYHDLSQSRREIRLLSILPGQLSDPIECQLQPHSLDERPVYEALSYVWGDSSNKLQIRLGGCPFHITRNLYTALRYLRKPDETRVMWIDALCINQGNIKERSHQVTLMNKIFSCATQVICWLATSDDHGICTSQGKSLSIHEALSLAWGDDEGWSDFRNYATSSPSLLDKCIRFQQTPILDKKTPHLQYTAPGKSYLNETLAAFALLYLLGAEDQNLFELTCFTHSPTPPTLRVASSFTKAFHVFQGLVEATWWDRAWIIQESIAAAKIIFMHYHIILPWTLLEDAAFHISEIANTYERLPPEQGGLFDLFRERVRNIARWRGINRHSMDSYSRLKYSLPKGKLLELLIDFRFREATDPRDKVYAVLGLVKRWESNEPIMPDYSVTVGQAYIQATMSLIKEEKSLIVLEGRPSTTNIHQLPSWVQDWSSKYFLDPEFRRVLESDYLYSTGGHQMPEPRLCCDSILVLEGLQVDTVKMVSSVCGSPNSRSDLVKTLADWEDDICNCGFSFDKPYINGQPALDALRRTWAADMLLTRLKSTRMLGMFGGPPPPFKRDITAESGLDWSNMNRKMEHLDELIRPVLVGHRFLVTERGYICIAPEAACVGDSVFVLKGGPLPFILRHSSAVVPTSGGRSHPQEQCFELVGSCYVHGIMDGEALESGENEFHPVYLL